MLEYRNNTSICMQALFADETEEYRSPAQANVGEWVTYRFRTLKDNVDEVVLVEGEDCHSLVLKESRGIFDYYELKLCLKENKFTYYFRLKKGEETVYFNKIGASYDLKEEYSFHLIPGFFTPDWAKGAVIYQIFVDRFYNGDKSNDVENGEYAYIGEQVSKVEDWNKYPAFMGIREFYGGDLQGVWDKLDYLEYLGVEVIYFNPIFVSPSNHKYDIQDYDYIDPHYGKIVKDQGELLSQGDLNNQNASRYICRVTDLENLEASNAFFADFVKEVHKRGMKIILDGVFNHCGSFNKWMDRERIYEGQEGYEHGAYIDKDSPYRSFFQFNDENAWPYNPRYNGWWGHDTLPKLNYSQSPKLKDYILSIAKKWVSEPYCVDGWRLDVAADLGSSEEENHQFWKDFRRVVKEANPNALILAEHYGDATRWLQGDEWDSVMNYDAFMEPITWFLTGMEKHSDSYIPHLEGNSTSLIQTVKFFERNMAKASVDVAMNELSNHDHSRFLTRTNHVAGRVQDLGWEAANQGVSLPTLRQAVVMQMTWTGAPTVYYGDEAGLCGFTDPDNRRSYPWGRENHELIDFHKEMIRIHKQYKSLKGGSLLFLWNDYRKFAYARFTKNEAVIVCLNASKEDSYCELPLWRVGLSVDESFKAQRIMLTDSSGYNIGIISSQIEEGLLKTMIPREGTLVFYVSLEKE